MSRVTYPAAFPAAGAPAWNPTDKQAYRGGEAGGAVIDLDMFGASAPAGTIWTCASTKRYRDEQGIIRTAAIDEWFTDHDFATLEPLGPWAEGPRSNELPDSWDLSATGAWAVRGVSTATISALADGPDLTADYSLIRNIGASGVNDVFDSLGPNFVNDERLEPSMMIRRVSLTGVLELRNSSGGSLGLWELDLSLLADGWLWITREHQAVTIINEFVASGTGSAGFQFSDAASGSLDFDAADVQLEVGTFSTSPMKTNGAAFDRLVTLWTADSLASLVNITEGTVTIHGRAQVINTPTDQNLVRIDDGGNAEQIKILIPASSTNIRWTVVNSIGENAFNEVSGPASKANYGIAATYEQDNSLLSVDGASGSPDAVFDLPLGAALSRYRIINEQGSARPYFGTISEHKVFDFADNANRDALAINAGKTPTKPLAPTGMTAAANGASKIDLTWNDIADNETGYRIERSLDGSTSWATVTTTAADVEVFQDSLLDPSTQYFYRVIAESALGDSAATNIANATTTA